MFFFINFHLFEKSKSENLRYNEIDKELMM